MALPLGTLAPEFELPSGTENQLLKLSSFRGRPVVLVFYPADFSPVCGDQLALYNELSDEFAKFDAQLLGISVDSTWCHQAYKESRQIEFPLLADFQPRGRVATLYDVFRPEDGIANRAIFVLDPAGIIRFVSVSVIWENPGADGILSALEAMPAGATGAR